MKIMPSRKEQRTGPDSDVPNGRMPAQVSDPITLEETKQHLKQLQCVSAVAAKLFTLLGEQITAVSCMAPIQRGFITV